MGMIAFAGVGAIYYWFPIVTGRMYNRTLAKAHFWLSMIGVNITFFAMLLAGYFEMPRRYATYEFNPSLAPLAEITLLHRAMTVGALIIAVGTVLWVVNVVWSWKKGRQITDPDPWDTKEYGLHGREFAWFEQQLTATDGGEETVATDGGETRNE